MRFFEDLNAVISDGTDEREPERDEEILDAEILRLLEAYGAAAIPLDRITQACIEVCENPRKRVQGRLMALAEQGRVRRSRVLPDRWLSVAG